MSLALMMSVREKELLKALKSQKTWRLVFLSVITYGVYTAHYITKQTRILNGTLDEENQISTKFTQALFYLSYFSALILILSILPEGGHTIERIGSFSDSIWGIMLVVWGFMARSRMNRLFSASKGDDQWFHGLWTFLWTPFYFNYKVNKLNESL